VTGTTTPGPTTPGPIARWVLGARPRTLAASAAPVAVGTALASPELGDVGWGRAALALVVALAAQVGANYVNDYSDGVRGTDERRSGPRRLTASGAASPQAVRLAAILAFTVAAVAGLVLSLLVNPWLLLLGVVVLVGAVAYSSGPRPLSSLGLGEVMVLVFFGIVPCVGSAYVQHEAVPSAAWWGSLLVGFLAVAILLANNVRDVDTDAAVGKRTLAVRLGAAWSRRLYVAAIVVAFVLVAPIGLDHAGAFAAWLAIPLAWRPIRTVTTARDPGPLIQALGDTGRLELMVTVALVAGIWATAGAAP